MKVNEREATVHKLEKGEVRSPESSEVQSLVSQQISEGNLVENSPKEPEIERNWKEVEYQEEESKV